MNLLVSSDYPFWLQK